ncbi:MAG: hypothetical protein ABR507_12710 [Actinomycetota bacterium]|nr:hypothetical protein [Actinomycetota bacterium]
MEPTPEEFHSDEFGFVADEFQACDGWITGQALSEILALELQVSFADLCCPRCGSWRFTYGALQFCTYGCPENLLISPKLN